ncbi:MAG: hypothetical protein LBR62_00885, partial [Puniceicoccales bacterium]|nr:hypothetical protein [Puniceicoccales bacterium]
MGRKWIFLGIFELLPWGYGNPYPYILLSEKGTLSVPIENLLCALEVKFVTTPKAFWDYSQSQFLRGHCRNPSTGRKSFFEGKW